MNECPSYYEDVEACVEDVLCKLGWRINLGTPLGLGKANHLVNEFFRRAREDSRIDLRIFTALQSFYNDNGPLNIKVDADCIELLILG